MIAAAEPTAAAAPRIVPATRFAVARRLRVRAALACGESGEACGVLEVVVALFEVVDFCGPPDGRRAAVLRDALPDDDLVLVRPDAFFEPDFLADLGGEDFLPPRLAALREGGDVRAAVLRFFDAPVRRAPALREAADFFDDEFFAPPFEDPLTVAFFEEAFPEVAFLEVAFLEVAFLEVAFLEAVFFEPAFFAGDFRFEDDFFAPPPLLLPLLRFDLAAIRLALLWFHWRRQDASSGSGAPMRVSRSTVCRDAYEA